MNSPARIGRWLLARPRRANLVGALICIGLVAAAVAIEILADMPPCPLCVFQRIAFLVMAAGLLLGALRPGWLAGGITAVAALGGIGLAWRHLWLQSLPPDQVPACGPGLDYLLGTFPLAEVVSMVLSGSGECAEVDRILGVTIPAWTLLAYGLLGGLYVALNLAVTRRRRV